MFIAHAVVYLALTLFFTFYQTQKSSSENSARVILEHSDNKISEQKPLLSQNGLETPVLRLLIFPFPHLPILYCNITTGVLHLSLFRRRAPFDTSVPWK